MAEDESMYTAGDTVRHLDGSSLLRPQSPSKGSRVAIIVIALVAVVAGVVFLSWFFDTVFHAAAREQASLEENLSRDVSLDLPNVASLASMDDASIEQTLANGGYTTYTISSPTQDPADPLDIVKLPSDVSLDDAVVLYAQGVSNLSAPDAARLLKGSWRVDSSREDGTSVRVRYADFDSATLEDAISSAIASQGFDEASVTESGTDSSGNVFREGAVDVAGTAATWRVSAIELSNVYSIDGMPANAAYVGIRVTL